MCAQLLITGRRPPECRRSLPTNQRKAASFVWGGSEWRGWNYFGATGYVKPGLRLEQMTAAQKEAAWSVLGAVWSPAGVARQKATSATGGTW